MAKRKTKRGRLKRAATNRRNRSRSKSQERRVAQYLGARRTPLSGSASGHTSGDVIDPELYVEIKGASTSKSSNGWLWRMLAGTRPDGFTVLDVLNETDAELVHSSLLVADGEGRPITSPVGLARLWADTRMKAEKEEKIPLVVLLTYGRQGFWLYGDTDAMRIVRERRGKVERGKAD